MKEATVTAAGAAPEVGGQGAARNPLTTKETPKSSPRAQGDARAVDERARLDRRPEALVLQVDDLIADIEAGRLRIPKFQRPFKWKDEDRRKLFDSIYRGYPVGTLLLWRHPAPRDQVDWGGLRILAEQRSDALFVVDGQQRLATLALSLLDAEERSGVKSLYFDPENREVRMASRTRPVPSIWLPVSSAGDPSRLVEWLAGAALDRQLEAAAKEFAKRVQQARLPAYVVDVGDEETVRRLFERVNRSGHPLKGPEVFDALHGSFRGDRPSSLRDLIGMLALETRFGALDEDTALGALFAIRQGTPARKLDDFLAKLPPEDRDELIEKALPALRSAIQFLRSDAAIPHRKFVPYASILPVLARFFHLHPDPHRRSRLLLRRWVYRGAMSGAHRGDMLGRRLALDAVGENEHQSIQALLATVESPTPTVTGALKPFHGSHARSRLEALALANLEPRSLETGEPVDLPAIAEASQRGELTQLPIILVRDLPANEYNLAGTLANRALHERHRLAQKLREATDPDILASHAVSPEAHEALVAGDGPRFLRLRAETLEGVVAHFLRSRAELGADDGPPPDALAIEDPEP